MAERAPRDQEWPDDDNALARTVVAQASAELVRLRSLWPSRGTPGREALAVAGDRAAQALLDRALRAARPGDALRSEEAADSDDRRWATRVWIVDPLDGSREFAEAGRTDWTTHVALWADGRLLAAAVGLPARGVLFSTGRSARWPQAHPHERLRIAVSRTRPPSWIGELAGRLGAEVIGMGSCGAKAVAVLEGRVDAYVHDGGQWEWDSAAPVAVGQAAGLHTSRVDGSPLVYNQDDPWLPDLVICRSALADGLLAAIGSTRRTDL